MRLRAPNASATLGLQHQTAPPLLAEDAHPTAFPLHHRPPPRPTQLQRLPCASPGHPLRSCVAPLTQSFLPIADPLAGVALLAASPDPLSFEVQIGISVSHRRRRSRMDGLVSDRRSRRGPAVVSISLAMEAAMRTIVAASIGDGFLLKESYAVQVLQLPDVQARFLSQAVIEWKELIKVFVFVMVFCFMETTWCVFALQTYVRWPV